MRPLEALEPDRCKSVRAVFSDIDDTMTTGGKLPAAAYEAMWRLQEAEIPFVPITGRPAGWCDLIARQWPIDGVIGENGALAYFESGGKLERIYHPETISDAQERLGVIREAVLAEVEGSRVSKDQFCRLFDLAIDFCEEPPDLGLEGAEAIRAIFARFGAEAKVSSIHVNGWFGNYNKLSMAEIYASERWGESLSDAPGSYLFCGDSPNDEPMFAFFPLSCGVANVHEFSSEMQSLPTFIAEREGGEGFAQIIDTFLKHREGGG